MSRRRRGLILATATATALSLAAPAQAAVVAEPHTNSAADAALKLTPIDSYETGQFDASAAEIVTYHAESKRILTVNAQSGQIDVLDASNPAELKKIGTVSGVADTTINSVAVRKDGLAVATVEPSNKTDAGKLMFFDARAETFAALGFVGVGSLPDMVTMTEDGKYALVANEGEPAEDYSVDPEGSISVIALQDTVAASTDADVRTADFTAFEGKLAEKGLRIFGQVGASTTEAQNIEPEYIAVAGGKAYATLQENNGVAVIDIETATVEDVWSLGTIDRMTVPFDPSDRDLDGDDGKINIVKGWPIKAFRLPDAIGAYEVNGRTYLVTANEGDARDWDAYSEEARLKDLGNEEGLPGLCEGFAGMTAEEIEDFQSDEKAGRLNITTSAGLNADGSCYEEIYTYGGRGFSIFTAAGELVYDSEDDFEQITAATHPEFFNSNHSESNFEGRSDDKGPEPEGLAMGVIGDRTYAFIGNERVGGVMVYDVTTPAQAKYVTYVNNRDFSISMEDVIGDAEDAAKEAGTDKDAAAAAAIEANLSKAGDLGPEGLAFIPAADSPNRKNLLVVGNEVSGTTTVFEIEDLLASDDDQGSTVGSSDDNEGSSADITVGGSSFNPIAAVVVAVLGLVAGLGGALALNPQLMGKLQAIINDLLP